jgi:multidrug efflux pump subunit AcrA (membrane-fusion protein)
MIGMTAETNIVISESKNALLIPATALQDGHVFVRKGRSVEKIPVKIGAKSGEKIEIIDGITEQDEIIADANSLENK